MSGLVELFPSSSSFASSSSYLWRPLAANENSNFHDNAHLFGRRLLSAAAAPAPPSRLPPSSSPYDRDDGGGGDPYHHQSNHHENFRHHLSITAITNLSSAGAFHPFTTTHSPLPPAPPFWSSGGGGNGGNGNGLQVGNVSAYVTHRASANLSDALAAFGNSTGLFGTSSALNDTSSSSGGGHPVTIILEPDLRLHHPLLAFFLSLICFIVVFGNVLTIVAIWKERYLHTVTNYFVASLAVADCIVGSVVMPFSIVHEVMNKWWIFGQDWCDLWHSFDVLASTASILNLCIISLDRYWAITDPITYPSRMTPKKALLFIAAVWLSSSLISFPAIVWWRATQKELQPYRCNFTDDVGYLVFSSTISFYGPLTVMVFTYYRIYVIASRQTRALKLGVKQIELSSVSNDHHGGDHTTGNGSECGSQGGGGGGAFTLRMHRGGYQLNSSLINYMNSTSNTTSSSTVTSGKPNHPSHHPHHPHPHPAIQHQQSSASNRSSHERLSKSESYDTELGTHCGEGNSSVRGAAGRLNTVSSSSGNKANWSVGRRLAKLAKERKAAKTLGIVMGVFIISWMPFFILNILTGICPQRCILMPDLSYSVVTWLGWINSGMNPIIYACWSKDFRRAFRKILCSCCCTANSNLSYDRNRIYKAPNNNRTGAGGKGGGLRNYYHYKSKKIIATTTAPTTTAAAAAAVQKRSTSESDKESADAAAEVEADKQTVVDVNSNFEPPPPPPPSSKLRTIEETAENNNSSSNSNKGSKEEEEKEEAASRRGAQSFRLKALHGLKTVQEEVQQQQQQQEMNGSPPLLRTLSSNGGNRSGGGGEVMMIRMHLVSTSSSNGSGGGGGGGGHRITESAAPPETSNSKPNSSSSPFSNSHSHSHSYSHHSTTRRVIVTANELPLASSVASSVLQMSSNRGNNNNNSNVSRNTSANSSMQSSAASSMMSTGVQQLKSPLISPSRNVEKSGNNNNNNSSLSSSSSCSWTTARTCNSRGQLPPPPPPSSSP